MDEEKVSNFAEEIRGYYEGGVDFSSDDNDFSGFLDDVYGGIASTVGGLKDHPDEYDMFGKKKGQIQMSESNSSDLESSDSDSDESPFLEKEDSAESPGRLQTTSNQNAINGGSSDLESPEPDNISGGEPQYGAEEGSDSDSDSDESPFLEKEDEKDDEKKVELQITSESGGSDLESPERRQTQTSAESPDVDSLLKEIYM